MASARAVMRRRTVGVLASLVLTSGLAGLAPASAPPDGPRPRDAMAYIRVVGDVTLDYHDARLPVVKKDVPIATGSGFVIAPSGLVLTNHHVVEVEPSVRADGPDLVVENRRLQVFVGSGAWEAHVVAADPQRDLAALQMTAADLPYLPLGDSDAAEAGRLGPGARLPVRPPDRGGEARGRRRDPAGERHGGIALGDARGRRGRNPLPADGRLGAARQQRRADARRGRLRDGRRAHEARCRRDERREPASRSPSTT